MKNILKITLILINLIIGNSLLFAVEDESLKRIFQDDCKNIPKPLLRIISIDLDNIPLAEALSIITRKGKIKLNYNRRDIPALKKVSVKMKAVTVLKVLKKILVKTNTEIVATKGGLFAIVPKEKKRSRKGTVSGKVSEIYNNKEIAGVYVGIINTKFSTVSNENGEFIIPNVSVGSYNVRFSADGFKTVNKTDVIIRSKRITSLDIKMQEQLLPLQETIEVSASYFHKSEKNPVSTVSISAEEVRRAPGTGGGITRMLKVLPGVTTSADEDTDLVVRGGSPYENGYIIDNIEVSHIDHLPNLASSGGSYPALNADLIQNVNFYTGGFSSNYNGYLSAITDITLREGNRKEFDGQLNIDMAGIGFIFEGPISKGRGSMLVTFRKSYFKFLKNLDLLDVGGAIASIDGQFKIAYDLSPTQKIELLYFHLSGENDESGTGMYFQENQFYSQNTLGINWTSNWSETFFSNTSFAFSSFKNLTGEVLSILDYTTIPWHYNNLSLWDVDDVTSWISLRNFNYLVLNNQNKLEFGLQMKKESHTLEENIYFQVNSSLPQRNIHKYNTTKAGLFLSYIGTFFKRLNTTIGLRGDYSSASNRFHLVPRFSLNYKINQWLSLCGGMGVFYQPLPTAFLAYIPGAINLKNMKATHYSLGLECFLGNGTKLTLEGYIKSYENLPISPDNKRWLAMDYTVARFRENYFVPVGYRLPKTLHDGGSGSSRGVELLIQKKLVEKIYGFFSASCFRSKYKDLTGETHNRVYDNRFTLNLSIGYKASRFWEFSAKWTLMGGGPYTPIDVEISRQNKGWIVDDSRFLRSRYPTYSSLNFRVDKRFYFRSTNLTIYLDMWNVFNRKNILFHYWSTGEESIMPVYQMGILPVLGIEFEF